MIEKIVYGYVGEKAYKTLIEAGTPYICSEDTLYHLEMENGYELDFMLMLKTIDGERRVGLTDLPSKDVMWIVREMEPDATRTMYPGIDYYTKGQETAVNPDYIRTVTAEHVYRIPLDEIKRLAEKRWAPKDGKAAKHGDAAIELAQGLKKLATAQKVTECGVDE